jgi:small nuclear ribonucleoprotein
MVLPLDLLEKSVNTRMTLILKDGRTLEGKLAGYDQYMNLVLEETNESTESGERKVGTIVLRGNNVVSMSPVT